MLASIRCAATTPSISALMLIRPSPSVTGSISLSTWATAGSRQSSTSSSFPSLPRREQHEERRERAEREEGEPDEARGDTPGALALTFLEQVAEDGDERGRKSGVGDERADRVRDEKRDLERVHGALDAEVVLRHH